MVGLGCNFKQASTTIPSVPIVVVVVVVVMWCGGERSSVLLYYYRIIYVCCIGALIFYILNSLHHEVVRSNTCISSNHRILYNTHTHTHIYIYIYIYIYIHYSLHLPVCHLIKLFWIHTSTWSYSSIGKVVVVVVCGGVSIVMCYWYSICVLYRSPHI